MKKEESNILDKLGKDAGFKVPDNFFDQFNTKVVESLPEVKITPTDVKPSTWMRIRPYIYMAAMFAGIWCMMKVFNGVNGSGNGSNAPAEISAGIQNEENADDFIMTGNGSDFDMMYEDSVAQQSDSAEQAKLPQNIK